jgi:hypothetical protein
MSNVPSASRGQPENGRWHVTESSHLPDSCLAQKRRRLSSRMLYPSFIIIIHHLLTRLQCPKSFNVVILGEPDISESDNDTFWICTS